VAGLFCELSKHYGYAIFKQNQTSHSADLVSHFALLRLHGVDFLHREIRQNESKKIDARILQRRFATSEFQPATASKGIPQIDIMVATRRSGAVKTMDEKQQDSIKLNGI
jgi:hypothetical protein